MDTGFKLLDFVDTLKNNGISVLIDVRSLPYSQHYSDYNKENLDKVLKKNHIYYRNYKAEFGARQEKREYYPHGYLDFEMFSKSSRFLSGVEKIEKSMMQDYTIALMCSEKDPIMCHRAILVARAFHESGYNVVHLLQSGKTSTQKELEERLLDKYFPDRGQISMFSENLSLQEYTEAAYRKQNAVIGYTLVGEAV